MTLSRFEGIGCKSVSRQKTELQQDPERIRNQECRQTDQTRQTGEHSAVHKESSGTDPGDHAGRLLPGRAESRTEHPENSERTETRCSSPGDLKTGTVFPGWIRKACCRSGTPSRAGVSLKVRKKYDKGE